jgi:hypothetical protein
MARHGHAALSRASATDLDEVAHALCEQPAVLAVASPVRPRGDDHGRWRTCAPKPTGSA